ncbi:Gfo/Idh/MocA family oxidoreductase [uncultured Sphaerochaeta sp.]|uniref:Gfo/Idh/MocA family protein n=1 Tax=uncultured Sphaerochaeta sp. TaxID=886478 RepID=UPI002A0A570F|nr:Gfo/Idh/MocA family oxidoreductase [uncultured Sphaerochaeta sp.]
MKTIGFGVIGCGFIGKLHARVIARTKGAKLIAVVDQDEKEAKNVSANFACQFHTDYHTLFSNPEVDAIVICLPSGLHSVVALEAANAKKHILCEKPIDIEVSRAEQMVAAACSNGVAFGCIMQHRFDKPIELLKQYIDSGKLGKVLWGSAKTIWYRDDVYFSNPWRGTWKYDGGGALINQSIHYIDLLLYIMGKPKSVSAKCRTLLHSQIETEDVGVANIEFENGAIGTIEGTTVAYPGLFAELAIYAEKGSVIIKNDELLFYQFMDGKDENFEKLMSPSKANALNVSPDIDEESHARQYQDFVEAIQNGRSPRVTGKDALASLALIKSIYVASDKKEEVYFK